METCAQNRNLKRIISAKQCSKNHQHQNSPHFDYLRKMYSNDS